MNNPHTHTYTHTHTHTLFPQITVCCIEVCIRICSRKKDTPPPRIPRKQPKQKYSPPREKDEEVPEPSDQTDMPQGNQYVLKYGRVSLSGHS